MNKEEKRVILQLVTHYNLPNDEHTVTIQYSVLGGNEKKVTITSHPDFSLAIGDARALLHILLESLWQEESH